MIFTLSFTQGRWRTSNYHPLQNNLVQSGRLFSSLSQQTQITSWSVFLKAVILVGFLWNPYKPSTSLSKHGNKAAPNIPPEIWPCDRHPQYIPLKYGTFWQHHRFVDWYNLWSIYNPHLFLQYFCLANYSPFCICSEDFYRLKCASLHLSSLGFILVMLDDLSNLSRSFQIPVLSFRGLQLPPTLVFSADLCVYSLFPHPNH